MHHSARELAFLPQAALGLHMSVCMYVSAYVQVYACTQVCVCTCECRCMRLNVSAHVPECA